MPFAVAEYVSARCSRISAEDHFPFGRQVNSAIFIPAVVRSIALRTVSNSGCIHLVRHGLEYALHIQSMKFSKIMKPLLSALIFLALLAGCSSNQKSGSQAPAPSPTPKATDAETGRIAFQKMYIQARYWAPDAQGFLLESQPTKEIRGIDGKSAVWSARFGSRARNAAKAFVWSGSDAEDAPARGTAPSSEDSFNPNNSSTQTFDIGFMKADSNQAFNTAQEHGGKALLDKDATLPVSYRAQWSSRDNSVIWHVIYGNSKLVVVVDAATGEFIRVDK